MLGGLVLQVYLYHTGIISAHISVLCDIMKTDQRKL